jgi:hypothetical protein
MEELRERAICLWQDEHYLLASWNKPPSFSSSSSAAGVSGSGGSGGGDSSPHQTEQEKLAEVSKHELCIIYTRIVGKNFLLVKFSPGKVLYMYRTIKVSH